MTSIQTRRANVLAEAIVSGYLNELSARERPSRRVPREPARTPREPARAPRLGRVREQMRRRRELVPA